MWRHKEEMGQRKTNYFKIGEVMTCLYAEGNNPVMRETVILQERDMWEPNLGGGERNGILRVSEELHLETQRLFHQTIK